MTHRILVYTTKTSLRFSLFRNLYLNLLRNTPKLCASSNYVTFSSELHSNVVDMEQAKKLEEIVSKLFPRKKALVSVNFGEAEELFQATQNQSKHKLRLTLAETLTHFVSLLSYLSSASCAISSGVFGVAFKL